MTDLFRRAAAWLQRTWARWALAILAVVSVIVLSAMPGSRLFVQELAYNVIRALAALIMFELMLRYSTRKISGAVPAQTGRQVGYQFGDMFLRMYEHPIGIAIFLAAAMLARGQIVVAVWR